MIQEWYRPQFATGGDLEYAEKFFLDGTYVAQEKLDGVRYIVQRDLDGSVKIYSRGFVSRKGDPRYGLPVLKTAQLAHIAAEFAAWAPPGSVIDGEVVAPVETASLFDLKQSCSTVVTRVTGATPDLALAWQRQNGFLRYAAFDVLAWDGQDITGSAYFSRYEILFQKLRDRSPIEAPAIYALPIALHEQDKRALFKTIVAAGGEGIILKDYGAPYHQDARTSSWVKVKKVIDVDVVFMGINLATEETVKKDGALTDSRIKGKAGSFRYGQYMLDTPPNGMFDEAPEWRLVELGSCGGFSDEVRDEVMADLEERIEAGPVFTIRAQERHPSGALRHPKFITWRYDKCKEECVYREGEA